MKSKEHQEAIAALQLVRQELAFHPSDQRFLTAPQWVANALNNFLYGEAYRNKVKLSRQHAETTLKALEESLAS